MNRKLTFAWSAAFKPLECALADQLQSIWGHSFAIAAAAGHSPAPLSNGSGDHLLSTINHPLSVHD